MEAQKVAELTTQIVSSALQSEHIPSYSAEKVCEYYARVYEQIAKCSNEYNAAIMASTPELP